MVRLSTSTLCYYHRNIAIPSVRYDTIFVGTVGSWMLVTSLCSAAILRPARMFFAHCSLLCVQFISIK